MSASNGMERDARPSPSEPGYPTESTAATSTRHAGLEPDAENDRHGGHGLMMIVCCIPMLAIAALLFFTGAAGSGVIVAALVCTAMMAAMMFAMPGGHGGQSHK